MAPITIKVLKDGPLLISGDDVQNVAVVDASGIALQPRGKNVSLCRCGGSSNKPFCDGTHSKIGFQGAEQAVKEFDAQAKKDQ
ncbi:MAG: CDGSH iron-sulfur domain-containing protein [Gemmatimonadaceae bacterium]